jgi:hypothetical protein
MAEVAHPEPRLFKEFLESIQELPDASAEFAPGGDHGHLDRIFDARIDLKVAGQSIELLVEVKKAVYPRDVREFLWHLREVSHSAAPRRDRDRQFLLLAESISPGAKDLLRAERVGYFDSGGSLFLPGRSAYVYIDRPPPKPLQKSMRSLFSGRRAEVLHALLVHHREWFGVKDIAKLVQVAPSTASEVLSELDRFEWLASRGQGPTKERHLREPAALLDAWVKQLPSLKQPDMHRYYVPGTKTDALIERLGRTFEAHDVKYAVSYEAAAQRYAPFLSTVSQVRARVLAGPNADAAIVDIGARLVSEGANLAIIKTNSPGELLFRENLGEIWLASPIQVYLDLLRGEGRARELADHLRKERIGFLNGEACDSRGLQ